MRINRISRAYYLFLLHIFAIFHQPLLIFETPTAKGESGKGGEAMLPGWIRGAHWWGDLQWRKWQQVCSIFKLASICCCCCKFSTCLCKILDLVRPQPTLEVFWWLPLQRVWRLEGEDSQGSGKMKLKEVMRRMRRAQFCSEILTSEVYFCSALCNKWYTFTQIAVPSLDQAKYDQFGIFDFLSFLNLELLSKILNKS